jgi:hypothetical protein
MVWLERLEPRLLLDAGLQGEYFTQFAPITPAGPQVEATVLPEVAGQATITGELRCWHKVTFTWAGPNTSETAATNPFLNYRLNVTFTGPSGQTYVVPGYFAADGNAANTGATSGSKWRCHFAPDEAGQWTYGVSFRTGSSVAIDLSPTAGSSGGHMDGDAGAFSVEATDKAGLDLRGKGLLEYVGEHYYQFAGTGEYFLKQGADSPENLLAYEDFDNTPNNGGRRKSWSAHAGDFRSGDPTWAGGKGTELIGAINYLASEGMNAFSFLTMNINGDDQNVFPYVSTGDRTRIDVSKVAQWEIVFEHATNNGFFLHFKTQETENDQLLDGGALGTERKLYYRELVARFGHHLALNWNLGEENTNTDAQRRQFADYFEAIDPYNHPVVVHTFPGDHDTVYNPLLGYPNFEGPSIQTNAGNVFNATKTWVDRSASSGRNWVVCNDEQGNANTGIMPDANDAAHDGVRRDVLWGNLLAGGAGNEYYFGYDYAHSDLTCQDFRSRNLWWDQCRYAMRFFYDNDIPFWQMSNDNALSSASNDYCFSKPGEVYVVYLKSGGSTNLNLSGVGGQFEVQWYDPRNGGVLQAGSVTSVSGGGMRSLGNAPNETSKDWTILIRPGSGAPIANAGSDQSLIDADDSGAEKVTLDGSGSYAPGGLITSYVWTEGGKQIATVRNPTVTLPVGSHTITLTVTDDEGASDDDIVIVTVQEFANEQTVTFNPTDDGSADPGFKTTTIRAQWDRSDRIGYFRFDVSGINGNVTDVKLKLRCNGDAGNGPMRVYQGSHSNWSEINTGSLPAAGVLAGELNQSYSIGTWYTWNLSNHGITDDGTYTFILKHEVGGSDAWFDSRETSNDPVLQVTYAVAVVDPPTILSWSSASTHGDMGEILLAIPDDGTFSEPRNGGLRRLVVQFSEAIDPDSFTAASVQVAGLDLSGNDVNLSGITISASTGKGDTEGVIDFSTSLPNMAKYVVRIQGPTDGAGIALAGDDDRVITALIGDANADRRVDTTDLSLIFANRVNPISPGTLNHVRSDVFTDGRVNSTDLSAAWGSQADARYIPDPVLAMAAAAPTGAMAVAMEPTRAVLAVAEPRTVPLAAFSSALAAERRRQPTSLSVVPAGVVPLLATHPGLPAVAHAAMGPAVSNTAPVARPAKPELPAVAWHPAGIRLAPLPLALPTAAAADQPRRPVMASASPVGTVAVTAKRLLPGLEEPLLDVLAAVDRLLKL